MQAMVQTARASKLERKEKDVVLTSLYELIATLNKEVCPEEDWVVTNAVLDLFETGRAKFLSLN